MKLPTGHFFSRTHLLCLPSFPLADSEHTNYWSPAKTDKILVKEADHNLKLKDFSLYLCSWGSNHSAARLSATVQTSPKANPAPCTMGTGIFVRNKAARHGIDQPSRAEVEYWYGYTSAPPWHVTVQPVPLPLLEIRSPTSCSCKNLSASYGPCIFWIIKGFRIVRSKRWKSGLLVR